MFDPLLNLPLRVTNGLHIIKVAPLRGTCDGQQSRRIVITRRVKYSCRKYKMMVEVWKHYR
jgi:Txe/YoeB family toxin of Txe-Axe toxin-antitoxin module